MLKTRNLFIKGFVDPLSLIAVVFLVITVAVGTAVTNNRNITLSPEKEAATCDCVYGTLVGSACGASAGMACSVNSTPKATPKATPTPTCNCVNGTLTGSACGASLNMACGINTESPNTGSSNTTTQTENPTSTPTPTPTCDCIYGRLTGEGCGASLNMACGINTTPTPTPTPTPTSSPTPTPTCDCIYGRLTGSACGASLNMACSVYSTPVPTPTPTPVNLSAQIGKTPTPTPSTCLCVGGKYVGIACGHSAGYSCSDTKSVCEENTCLNKCASEVFGNVGSCINGGCICSLPKLKDNGLACNTSSECSSGNCYSGSQTLGGSPFDSNKTCHATSIAAMDTTVRDLSTKTGVGMAAELAVVVTAPVMADIVGLAAANGGISALPSAVYSYGTAAITTLPASVQTAMAIGGTVAGYAGVTAGTVACAQNPYSEACVAYVAGIQGDPMAMIQLGQSVDNIYNELNTTAHLQAIRNESIKQGKYFEWIVPENNSFGSITYEKSVAGEVGNTYDDLLGTIRRTMAEDNLGPVEAMSEVVRTYNPKVFTPIDPTELAYTVEDNTALSARLVCGNRLNCIELPVLEKNLLVDLGVPESQVQVIVGFGGSTGLPNYPNMHGALQVGDQVVGYYATPVNQNDFYRYANKLNWGNFGLPGFDASQWKAIASPG